MSQLASERRESYERQRFRHSAQVWWVEGGLEVLELTKRGLGRASIPEFLIHQPLACNELVVLVPDFMVSTGLALELQWHRTHPMGQAGRWLKAALQTQASLNS